MQVDYDQLAASYDRRYVEYDYSELAGVLGEFSSDIHAILEVGCGTGHWLDTLESNGSRVCGLDRSAQMLEVARRTHLDAFLTRGIASCLPYRDGSFDGVVLVNVLHHLADPARCIAEAGRVLRPGGRFLSIGLDPSARRDRWYVYDYFAGTLETDLRRYPPRSVISEWLRAAGFEGIETFIAQRMEASVEARAYLERGAAGKHSASQLVLLEREEYEAGLARIWADVRSAEEKGEALQLRGNLHLHATRGTLRSDPTTDGTT